MTEARNCGPACQFCGRCGKKINDLPGGMTIPVLAPPGVKTNTSVNADDLKKAAAAMNATNEAGEIR